MAKMNKVAWIFPCLVCLAVTSFPRAKGGAGVPLPGATGGLTKAQVVDANLKVTARYATRLEVQWEVNSNELIQECLLTIFYGSTQDVRDCLQPSRQISEKFQDSVFDYTKKYGRNNAVARSFNEDFAPLSSQTQMKGKDLNYKGDVERKTNFMDQLEEGRENSVVFYNITGLDACTSYDLQLIVVPIGFNTNDTNSYYYRDSLEQENTGPDETLPPKQLSCSISEQNEDIWIFSWQDPMIECPTSKFNVAWTAQSRWSSAVASMSYVTIEHQEQFIDFLAYADYHFAVSADYGDVTSANGSIVCTSPEKAPSAPQNVRATDYDQTSLLVEWDAPVAANGIIKSYVVFMNNSKESISVDVISQDTFYEATGLESCLNYSIEVVAVNGAGYGPPSDMITHLYESGGTSNLEFIVCHVNSSGVYTQWNPIYRDCKESSYEVWYSLYIPWKNETRSDETTVNVNHYDLPATDFYPGTEYNIIVATADFSLESGCAVNSSDTKSSPPSITELSATVSSVYVKWSPPEEANGLIQSYIISLTGDNGQSLHEFVDGSTTQVNVAEKILSGTSYEVEVAAINGFGEGEYSAPKTVTTLPSRS